MAVTLLGACNNLLAELVALYTTVVAPDADGSVTDSSCTCPSLLTDFWNAATRICLVVSVYGNRLDPPAKFSPTVRLTSLGLAGGGEGNGANNA